MEYNCPLTAVLEISVDIKTAKIFIYKRGRFCAPLIINRCFHLVLNEYPVGYLKTNSFCEELPSLRTLACAREYEMFYLSTPNLRPLRARALCYRSSHPPECPSQYLE